MKKQKKEKGWLDKKLEDPKFRKGFEEEYEKFMLGEQLAEIRHAAHLTQKEVAERIGTTASAISRYESASYDRYELGTLRKIVSACGGKMRIVMEPCL